MTIEDERIRQVLIRFHKSTISVDGIKGEEILAWLEKQGEKKIIVTDEQIHWLKWVIGRLPDIEKANEAEAVLTEFVEQLEKQGKKSKWTDEDEIGSDATIELLEYFINYAPEFRKPTIRRSIDWLKSLKKRMEE